MKFIPSCALPQDSIGMSMYLTPLFLLRFLLQIFKSFSLVDVFYQEVEGISRIEWESGKAFTDYFP